MVGVAHDESLPDILVVEDDAGVRRSILMLLKAHGLSAKAYGLGSAVVRDPSAPAARLLIADWQMPDMNGFEVLAALRALGWTGAALMLSGYYDALLAAKAKQEGFEEILPKPVLDYELISTVTRMLGQQSQIAPGVKRKPTDGFQRAL